MLLSTNIGLRVQIGGGRAACPTKPVVLRLFVLSLGEGGSSRAREKLPQPKGVFVSEITTCPLASVTIGAADEDAIPPGRWACTQSKNDGRPQGQSRWALVRDHFMAIGKRRPPASRRRLLDPRF